MAYGDPTEYNKYLDTKHGSSGCEGCEDKCSCCPPGLVAVYNVNGDHAGCLTPADADEYNANNKSCKEGYIALYKEGETPLFYGCVSEAEFATIYAIVNPTETP